LPAKLNNYLQQKPVHNKKYSQQNRLPLTMLRAIENATQKRRNATQKRHTKLK